MANPYSRKEEAAIWRMIGADFERTAVESADRDDVNPLTRCGLCYAARLSGLPSYWEIGRRLSCADSHGPIMEDCWPARMYAGVARVPFIEAAYHRALTAYLLAEMVEDGLAPFGD